MHPLCTHLQGGRLAGGVGACIPLFKSAVPGLVHAPVKELLTQQLCWGVPRSWLTQFGLLFKRALLAQLRNPTDVTARLFLSTWVGMLAGARPPYPVFALLWVQQMHAGLGREQG
jgi:hypothetical protein